MPVYAAVEIWEIQTNQNSGQEQPKQTLVFHILSFDPIHETKPWALFHPGSETFKSYYSHLHRTSAAPSAFLADTKWLMDIQRHKRESQSSQDTHKPQHTSAIEWPHWWHCTFPRLWMFIHSSLKHIWQSNHPRCLLMKAAAMVRWNQPQEKDMEVQNCMNENIPPSWLHARLGRPRNAAG